MAASTPAEAYRGAMRITLQIQLPSIEAYLKMLALLDTLIASGNVDFEIAAGPDEYTRGLIARIETSRS